MLKFYSMILIIVVGCSNATNERVFSLPGCQEVFCQSVLKQHNMYRRYRGVSPLKIDSILSEDAQRYAEHIAKQEQLSYSVSNDDYGESLFYLADESLRPNIKTCSYLGQKVSDSWYEEIKKYNFDRPNQLEDDETREFTQMVWKKSTKMGCGIGIGPSNSQFYVVVRYSPKGNVAGAFEANVPKKEEIRHLILRRIRRPNK